jgi:hypothetical protein
MTVFNRHDPHKEKARNRVIRMIEPENWSPAGETRCATANSGFWGESFARSKIFGS